MTPDNLPEPGHRLTGDETTAALVIFYIDHVCEKLARPRTRSIAADAVKLIARLKEIVAAMAARRSASELGLYHAAVESERRYPMTAARPGLTVSTIERGRR